MAECLSLTLLQDVRSFGSRVYSFTAEGEMPPDAALAVRLQKDATRAAVKIARASAARNPRDQKQHLLAAFRTISDAISGLDALAKEEPARAVEAAALAAEASDLAEQIYGVVAEEVLL